MVGCCKCQERIQHGGRSRTTENHGGNECELRAKRQKSYLRGTPWSSPFLRVENLSSVARALVLPISPHHIRTTQMQSPWVRIAARSRPRKRPLPEIMEQSAMTNLKSKSGLTAWKCGTPWSSGLNLCRRSWAWHRRSLPHHRDLRGSASACSTASRISRVCGMPRAEARRFTASSKDAGSRMLSCAVFFSDSNRVCRNLEKSRPDKT